MGEIRGRPYGSDSVNNMKYEMCDENAGCENPRTLGRPQGR